MNKKGLTLVEMIAVLVILSIIALIVTPNIYRNIVDYRDKMTEVQLNTIESATRNWVSDNIDKISSTGDYAVMIKVSELQSGAYLDKNLKNPEGGTFDNSDAFGLIYSKEVVDDTNNLDKNYIYEYGAYLDILDYEKKMAIRYVKDNGASNAETLENGDARVTVATSVLQSNGYMYTSIRNTNNGSVTIPSKNIIVIVSTDTAGDITYTASTN